MGVLCCLRLWAVAATVFTNFSKNPLISLKIGQHASKGIRRSHIGAMMKEIGQAMRKSRIIQQSE